MEELYQLEPFCLDREQKRELLAPKYEALTGFHYEKCPSYKNILDCMNGWGGGNQRIERCPLPAGAPV